MPDRIHRWITEEGTIRILSAVTTDSAKEASKSIGTSPEASRAVANMLTGGALMQLSLAPTDRMQFHLHHRGSIGEIIADAYTEITEDSIEALKTSPFKYVKVLEGPSPNDPGMLENTLVVVTGEFGRTPKVLTQKPPGRQHWPRCFSSIMAGAGIGGGRVYGKSDNRGGSVISNPIRPEELAATIYHALDIPLNEPQNNTGISRPITTGKPVMELFG